MVMALNSPKLAKQILCYFLPDLTLETKTTAMVCSFRGSGGRKFWIQYQRNSYRN